MGWGNKQVAGELKLSVKTVEKHRQAVMDKLDLHDTASLTRYAISKGIAAQDKGKPQATQPLLW